MITSQTELPTKCTYIVDRLNWKKNPVTTSTIKRGSFHIEKSNVKRLDFRLCPSSSLVINSPLLTGSIIGLYKRPSKPFKTKAPATVRNAFLQLKALTRDWRTWLRIIVPRPWPVEATPIAMDFRLSKHLGTIPKLETKTQLAPTPRTPKVRYKIIKFLANEATVRLSEQVRHPVMATTRQPNRFMRELAKGPKNKHKAIDIEPIQAAWKRREDGVKEV